MPPLTSAAATSGAKASTHTSLCGALTDQLASTQQRQGVADGFAVDVSGYKRLLELTEESANAQAAHFRARGHSVTVKALYAAVLLTDREIVGIAIEAGYAVPENERHLAFGRAVVRAVLAKAAPSATAPASEMGTP